jgi:hypothetical protein
VNNTPTTQTLPPLPYDMPRTPAEALRFGCDVEELGNSDSAWALWDAAVRTQDERSPSCGSSPRR